MMMRSLALAAALLFPIVAVAQQYLPQPDLATCQQRSAAQCQALGCDGKNTIYWWDCQTLTDGTAAVVIDSSRPDFAAVSPKGLGLTILEQSKLKTTAQMGALLPAPVVTVDAAVEK